MRISGSCLVLDKAFGSVFSAEIFIFAGACFFNSFASVSAGSVRGL